MGRNLIHIVDPAELSRLKAVTGAIVESPGTIDTNWLSRNHCVAVPVESASHFDERDAELLEAAMAAERVFECFAIATEPLREFPNALRVPTTKESLLSFSRECSHFNFLLVPPSSSIAVLCTVFDYFIIAGSKSFVERAIGGTIAEGFARFAEYASKSGETERLLSVARRYEGVH